MPAYPNASGRSGIASYEVGPDWIQVTFARDGMTYEYTEASVGTANLARMVQLARQGSGLHAFINTPAIYKNYSRIV